jgi:hypothetical protein
MISGRSNYTMLRSRLPLVAFVIFATFSCSGRAFLATGDAGVSIRKTYEPSK